MRNRIIEALKNILEKDNNIFAVWLEGADSLGLVDEYSDIDLVIDVLDGYEEQAFAIIESIIKNFGKLDLNWEAPPPTEKLRYKVFHIEGTSEHLLIDVNIQSHSRKFEFIEGHPCEKPAVLFDKKQVIVFKKLDETTIKQNALNEMPNIQAIFFQRSKVKKCILRKEFLEGLAYYQKTVLEPLIHLLRIQYTPWIPDYGLVHISQHLPRDVVQRLEKLHKTASLEELEQNFNEAELWLKDSMNALLEANKP